MYCTERLNWKLRLRAGRLEGFEILLVNVNVNGQTADDGSEWVRPILR